MIVNIREWGDRRGNRSFPAAAVGEGVVVAFVVLVLARRPPVCHGLRGGTLSPPLQTTRVWTRCKGRTAAAAARHSPPATARTCKVAGTAAGALAVV